MTNKPEPEEFLPVVLSDTKDEFEAVYIPDSWRDNHNLGIRYLQNRKRIVVEEAAPSLMHTVKAKLGELAITGGCIPDSTSDVPLPVRFMFHDVYMGEETP